MAAWRFNRNIVECKGAQRAWKNQQEERFNRNIVECKVLNPPFNKSVNRSFNRNIVECKVKPSGKGKAKWKKF